MTADTVVDLSRLTPAQLAKLAPLIRDAMRYKSYQLLPLGEDVAEYLRAKRKRLTRSSYVGVQEVATLAGAQK